MTQQPLFSAPSGRSNRAAAKPALRFFAWAFVLCAALIFGLRAAKMPGRGDACSLYYGSRLVLRGQNPYLRQNLQAEWERDGAQPQFHDVVDIFVFIYPPQAALLVAPVALLPPELGVPGMSLYGVFFGLLSLFFLYRLSSDWPPEGFAVFAGCVLLSRPLQAVIHNGQATLIFCALTAMLLDALARRRENQAGLLLGLALAKFTLTVPFLLLLLYRRQWRPAALALALFTVCNLALALPWGVGNMITDYKACVAKTAQPGAPQDPMGPSHFDMVHLDRLTSVLCGPTRRPLARALTLTFSLLAVSALLWLLRPVGDSLPLAPLEIALTMMSGLFLLYHRFYDLAGLMFVGWGLIAWRLERRGAVSGIWWFCLAMLLPLSFATSATGWSPLLDPQLIRLGLPPTPYYNVWLAAALFLGLLGLCGQARRASAQADGPEKDGPEKTETRLLPETAKAGAGQ